MMKKGIAKFTAFCMAAGMTLGGTGIVSMAAGADTSLVGIGSMLKASTPAKTEAQTEAPVMEMAVTEAVWTAEAPTAVADASGESAEVQTQTEIETEHETEAPLDTSMVNTTGFAQCDEYVNIRSSADTEGEVLGKLTNNAAVYILGVDENGWYKVKSGNVEGYVASQYIATGAAADTLSSEAGYHVAEVGAEVLNVRAAASEDSEVVTTVTGTQEVEVVEDCGEWLKVAVDADCYGYVSADYVNAEMQYKVAESIEEEQARLDAEYQAYLDQQAAEQAQAEAEYLAYLQQQEAANSQPEWEAPEEDTYYEDTTYEDTSYQGGSDSQAAADAAYQAYLDAQAAADAATQQADEQLVYDTADQAQQAYQDYLNAQAAADQAAVNGSQQGSTDSSADYTEDYTDEEYTDGSYVDDSYDDSYVDDSYDDSYEEVTDDEVYEDTSSGSGLGQDIVNFATQFVGNPYVWGGTSLTGGADCSGFTQSVMAHFGIGIPRTAASQSGSGTPVDLGSIQPGDLLFYEGGGSIGHVTIYMGGGQVVHASNPSTGITISDYGYRTPCSARRYW